jgi:hypothetical protein
LQKLDSRKQWDSNPPFPAWEIAKAFDYLYQIQRELPAHCLRFANHFPATDANHQPNQRTL